MSNRIPYRTIVAAKSGNNEAMAKILSHYAPYIRQWSKGNYWIYQEAQAKLMCAVMKFNPPKFDDRFPQQ